jgi:hypothetical protein
MQYLFFDILYVDTKSIDAIEFLWSIIQRTDLKKIGFRGLSNIKLIDESIYWTFSL